MSANILVRRALARDREQILALSAQVWEDDYLSHVVDKWTAEDGGEFSVALLHEKIVGFSKFSELAPGHGWLQGARVNPNLQGRGIGRALTRHHIDLARKRGFSALRMVTDSDNGASRALAEKLGFCLAAEYTRFRCPPLTGTEAEKVLHVPNFRGLPPVPDNGLVSAGWTFYPWREEMMQAWAREGKFYGTREAGMAMMQGNREERVNILMLWGEPDEVYPLLAFARRQPREIDRINCITCEDKYHRVLVQAGYENLDDHTMVVYQLNLG